MPRLPAPLALEIADYLALPITGKLDGTGQTDGMLARVNAFREEPGATERTFLVDLNGPRLHPRQDDQAPDDVSRLQRPRRPQRPLPQARVRSRFGNGVVTFQFDPDYSRNGRFYTVHIEDPALEASALPDNTNLPGFNVTGYSATAPIATPGPITAKAC